MTCCRKRHSPTGLMIVAAFVALTLSFAAHADDPYSTIQSPRAVKAFCAEIGGTYIAGVGCAVSYGRGGKSMNPRLQNSICRIAVERGQISPTRAAAILRSTCQEA
jgi:hypothetical protein